jgi:uncharacterized protein YegP (UPF0339 family)
MAAKFELKKAVDGQFYFNLKAGNGEVILKSEMYQARAGAENGIDSVKRNAPLPERFDRRTSTSGKPYFVLKAGNHEVIGMSEMYESEAARDNGIESVMTNAPEAEIVDVTGA